MTTKPKVCHITIAHHRYDIRIFQKECRSLAEAGYDVTLLVNDELPDEIKDGVRIVSTGQVQTSRVKRIIQGQYRLFNRARSIQADIYHVHEAELLPLCRSLKKQAHVIFDSHEFTVKQILIREYLTPTIRQVIAGGYAYLERKILPQLSAIIVPTTIHGENYFEQFGPKVVLINNYPTFEEMNLIDHHSDEHEGYACYLGLLNESRGIHQMIQAAALSKIPLYLGGATDTEETIALIQQMEQDGIGKYLGELTRQEVRETLESAAMGLSLLQDEGQYGLLDNLPTKVYEYMQMGIPTILSDFPYVKQVLEIYPFGIAVNPAAPEEIARIMRYLMEHPEDARRMGQAGVQAVREVFNWEVEAKKLVALYEWLAERPYTD